MCKLGQGIKLILHEYGFANYWNTEYVGNVEQFKKQIFQVMTDKDKQNLRAALPKSSMYNIYVNFKENCSLEPYLIKIINYRYRKALSKFRLRSNKLNVVTGCYKNIVLAERICKCCDLHQVEDEYHVLFHCTLYKDLRRNHFPMLEYGVKNLFQFYQIMTKSQYVYQLSKFVYYAMSRRKEKYIVIP